MTRKNTRIAAIIALATLGIGAGFAQAAGPHRGHGHRHTSTCGCDVQPIAGYLTINGRKVRITAGRGMNAQIVRAFRKHGYTAWIHDGCVRVDFGYCKPSVRWKTADYAARLSWGWDDLTFSLRKVQPRIYRPAHRPVRVKRSYRRVSRPGTCGW